MPADRSRPVLARRRLLAFAGAALVAGAAGPLRAAMPATPRQTEGPFYPVRMPLDVDNDLVRVTGSAAQAQGTVTHVAGRILDIDGRPVAGARVEIWQCDAQGIYLHPGSGDQSRRDGGFQGFGTAITDGDGHYRFRTIRPVPYTGRTPHIHYAVAAPSRPRFVTQMYVAGEPGNERDVLLRRMDAAERARLLVTLAPAPEIEAGALAGRFDIVIG